ncbi:hypothetical protein D8M19_05775 [Corynebacterium pseudodiphtheriticum]|nr:hypothetical protein D8M19_05775 [Corynebacterium pseudodiphtheriticum]
MDEKTLSITTGKREYTHLSVRKAYNSLKHLYQQQWLFSFLQPPQTPTTNNYQWASTTNSLEGGINAQLKLLTRGSTAADQASDNDECSNGGSTCTPKTPHHLSK